MEPQDALRDYRAAQAATMLTALLRVMKIKRRSNTKNASAPILVASEHEPQT